MGESAERVREFYRRQGEERERERIEKQLEEYGEDPIASKLDDFIRLAIDAESNDSLAKGCEWGAKDERARIIKLLSEMQITSLGTKTNKGKQTAWVLENAIVLIKKGQNV